MKQLKDCANDDNEILKDGLECEKKNSELGEIGSNDSVLDSQEKKEIESISVTKTIKKASFKKNYGHISDEIRLELLDAVKIKKEKIKHVAKRLGINYSSAKSICQVFEKEGRANRIIIKKKGLREDGSNGINNIEISQEIKAMFSLQASSKSDEGSVLSSAGSIDHPPQPSKVPFLTKVSGNKDTSTLNLPQVAPINAVPRQKANTVILSPVTIFSNGQPVINAPQTSIQRISLDSQLVSYPLQRFITTPSNEAPIMNHYFINNGFQQNKTPNLNVQMPRANNQTTHFYLATNMSKPEIFIHPPAQNISFVAPIQPLQTYLINDQQLNSKSTGNIIIPVIQTYNHSIGKGRFSLHM